MPASLVIDGLLKRFDGVIAVQNVSLSVKPGEIFGLLGPNGSGKSVILKVAAGLLKPDAGSVVAAGIDVVASPTAAKRRIGYIPNDPAGFERLTGHELLEFAGRLYGMERDRRDRRAKELIDRLDLGTSADLQFGDCSRDVRQRLAIAAALLSEPAVVMADEPFAWLDPRVGKAARDLLSEFVAAGGALLMSTHQLFLADHYCHRFGLMNNGRLVARGTLAELGAAAGAPGADLEKCYLRLVR